MKKLKIIFLVIFIMLLSSCLGTKKTIEKTSNTKSIEKVETKTDTVSSETINKGINDTVTVEVPISDPFVDAKIDEILSKLNTKKSSGDNSYRLYYDKKLRELRAEFEVGETRNKEIETNNEVASEKTLEKTVSENVKKVIRIIPWWLWIILIWIIRKPIISIISIFIPGVKGINTIQDLLNPPNKNKDGNN